MTIISSEQMLETTIAFLDSELGPRVYGSQVSRFIKEEQDSYLNSILITELYDSNIYHKNNPLFVRQLYHGSMILLYDVTAKNNDEKKMILIPDVQEVPFSQPLSDDGRKKVDNLVYDAEYLDMVNKLINYGEINESVYIAKINELTGDISNLTREIKSDSEKPQDFIGRVQDLMFKIK